MTNQWQKLVDYKEKGLCCGCVLRVPSEFEYNGSWYAEAVTDLMLINLKTCSQFALIPITGYHAGDISIILPVDALDGYCLTLDWLIENWNKWVYPDGNINNVWVKEKMEAPDSLPDGSTPIRKAAK